LRDFNRLNDLAQEKIKANINKERVNKKAFNFIVSNVEGVTKKLSDFEGKVIVIDHFNLEEKNLKNHHEILQTIATKYKNNKDVKVILINSLEELKGEKKDQALRDYIKKNNCAYTVLVGQDRICYESKYMYIIDQNRNVQFVIRSSYLFDTKDNALAVVNELIAKIDYLLSKESNPIR